MVSKPLSVMKRFPLRHLLLPLALLAAGPLMAQPVPTAAIEPVAASTDLSFEGSVQALRQSTVAAQLNANVLVLAVKAGDSVRAGQLLVRLDERDTQAALHSAQAGIVMAESQRRLALSSAERSRELRSTGFISQAALDSAEAQLRAAQAGVDQARAGQAQAALARGYTAVNAPFDAIVLATHVEAGELASAGRPLVTLYAPGALRAVVQLPSSMAAMARKTDRRQVQLPSGAWVDALRTTELPGTDAISQTVEWRLDLPPGLLLAPGLAVRVRLAGAPVAKDRRQTPVVPASAVLRRGELTAVYVVDGEHFVLRAVRLGAALGDAGFELLAGLRSGERVALDPVRAGLAGARPAP